MQPQAVQVIVDEQYIKKIAEEQIQQILKNSKIGCWWDMKRLEHETCRKRDWLLNNILENPLYKDEMAKITNQCDGGRWLIRADLMSQFLKDNFHNLNRRKRG